MAVGLVRHGSMREDENVVHAIEDGYGTALNSTTLQAAVTALAGAPKTVLLTPGTWTITSNLTIPENTVLEIPPGATVHVNTGVTLTTRIRCDDRQACFTGPGQVSLPKMTRILPQWFGALGDDSTDNGTALQKAVNACPAGGEVFLSPGTYRYTGTILINKAISFRGQNRIVTFLRPMTPNMPGLSVTSGFCRITDFGMDRVVKPVAGGDGLVMGQLTGNTTLARLWINKQYRGLVLGCVDIAFANTITVQNSETHGVYCDYGTNGAMQWYLTEILVQGNLGDGFHCANSTAATGIGPFLKDCHSFHNGLTGYYFSGADANHTLNDVWVLRCASSSESVCGIHFDHPFGELSMVHDCWVELVGMTSGIPRGFDGTLSPMTNSGYGIRLTGAAANGGVNVVGGLVWACAWSGIDVEMTNSHVNGLTLEDNGQAQHASLENRAGLVLKTPSAHISGCSFIRNTGNNGQSRGITVSGTILYAGIDSSNMFAGYLLANMVDSSLAVFSGTVPAQATLGLGVHVGRLSLTLFDETGGPTPAKPMRVSAGNLDILNNAVSAVIFQVRDNGIVTCPATTGAFKPPVLTSAQEAVLTAEDGFLIYNSTLGTMRYRKAGAWVSI